MSAWRSPAGHAGLRQVLLLALLCFSISHPILVALRANNLAVPLSPQAGIALAGLLCWGWRVVPGVFLGYIAQVIAVMTDLGRVDLPVAAWLAMAAALQALLAHALVRRFIPGPLLLNSPREMIKFLLLGAGLANIVGPTLAMPALREFQGLPAAQDMSGIWLDWWMGEAMGVLVFCPLLLCLLARPRSAWAPRRLSVALPLGLAALVYGLAVGYTARWEQQRHVNAFRREAAIAGNAIENALRMPLATLATTGRLLRLEPQITRERFRAATAGLLKTAGKVDFLGHASLVPRDAAALMAFEAAAQADGHAGFHAHDSQHPDAVPPGDEALLVIRNLEPLHRSPGVLGLNLRSTGGAHATLPTVQRSGEPVASEGFLQDSEAARLGDVRVALMQGLYDGEPASDEARIRAFRGTVFVVVRTEALVQAVRVRLSHLLVVCLVDADPAARQRRLAGPAGCELASAAPTEFRRNLHFGGRDWTLRLSPAVREPVDASVSGKLIAGSGMLIVGLLNMLLLSMAGRSQLVESLAVQRSTELDEASQALAWHEQRFRSVFDNAPVGVLIADLQGNPLQGNPKFCSMMACPETQLQEFYRPYAAMDASQVSALIDGRPLAPMHRMYTRRDGQEMQALVSLNLLHDETGRPERLLCVIQDISDQLKRVEHEQARDAALSANRAKSEFVSHMSHELRTPLNGMLGFTQLLLLGPAHSLSAQQRQWIEKIGQAGWYLLAMINNILDLSRIETGHMQLSLTTLDMNRLGDEVRSQFADAAAARGIVMELRLAALACHAVGDATRVREALGQLVSNAIKYNVEGGRVVLDIGRDDAGRVAVRVTDAGPGLDAGQLGQLFQPFRRLCRERSAVEGTGIGLVLARRLAQLMQGDVTVQSTPGLGSSFTLHLPAAAPPELPAAAPGPQAADAAAWTGSRRVVYVEDNPVNIEVMRAVLAQRSGVNFVACEDGASALAGLSAEPADLVMLDMHLPDTDGLSLLRELRQMPQCADVPILMVSAEGLEEQMQRCHDAGATDYVIKPFDIRDLLARVDRLLSGAQH